MKLIRDLSISVKVLIAPAILIVALGVVSYLAIYGLNAQRSMLGKVQSIALERVTLLNEFTVLSEQVQSDLFRVSVLHFMDVPDKEVLPIVDQLEQGLHDLDIIYGQILTKWSLDETEQALLDSMREPMTAFRQQAEQATSVIADNPSFGILLVRSSAVPFAEFQDALAQFRDYQQAQIVRAEAESARMVNVGTAIILSIGLAIGLAGTLFALLISTYLISRPIGAMTALMRRLAEGELSIEVGDVARKDEIGAMARAIQVFRNNEGERARLNEAVHASQERLQDLYDNAPSAYFSIGTDGLVRRCNKRAEDLLGYSVEDLVGRPVLDLYADTPEGKGKAAKVFEQFLAGQTVVDQELQMKKADGTPIWVSLTVNVIHDAQGQVVESRSMVVNIAERKRAEAEIESLARFPGENPNPVLRIARDGTILYANRGSQCLLGAWDCQVGQKLPDEWKRVVRDALRSGASQDAESVCEEQILSLTFAPVPVADYVNIYGLDVTARMRAEEAMIQASRLEATATLAGGIAHRVNNLMVGVLGYAELLKESLADRPDDLDMLDTISRSAEQAGDLALHMLTFARGARYQPQSMNLNDVIQTVLRAQERSLPSEIDVKLDMVPDLWHVEADPIQMNQVVLNLFDNAVEAIENRGRITIATRNVVLDASQAGLSAGPHVCLSMQDTGHGMSAETQAKIFEPFFTTKFEGRGLGLAAAHGIVKNHGGHITVESELGHGSTLAVYLPARQVEGTQRRGSAGAQG